MGRKKQPDEDNGFAEWGGYMGAKVQKLQQQFRADVANNPFKKSDLFSGISIHVNGLTIPTADELKRIMMTHGGVYDTYHRPGATTFIVAQNLPDVKIRAMASSKKLIISPDWIVDCVSEKRLLDYSKYLLYTNFRTNQPKIAFEKLAKNPSIGTDPITEAPIDNIFAEQNSMPNNEPSNCVADIKGSNLDNTLHDGFTSFVVDEEDMFADDIEDPISAESISNKPAENTPINSDSAEDKGELNILQDLQFLNDQIRQSVRKPSDLPVDLRCANPSVPETLKSKQQALTAVDPNFLTEFYNNSRLHHIATLGAGFKNHISTLRDSSDGSFPGRSELCQKFPLRIPNVAVPSSIMHIDMDCFFVSVGLRERPHLRGQPVAVTHSKGGGRASARPGADPQKERAMYAARRQMNHGTTENRMETKTKELGIDGTDSLAEIASCSYEARKMGLKNGMFVGAALKLCPNLKTIPYDFDQYKDVAHTLYNTLAKYTLDIEAVSCDEMYVDLESVLTATGLTAEDFVTHIRSEIQALTGCPCSAGVGANRLQARMATKEAKPNGQFFLHQNAVEEYFGSIAISDLPGVGYTTTQKLNKLGWMTCADLRDISVKKLQAELGKKFGETLYQFCRGIDTKPLVFGQIRKSVSAEVNYGIRFTIESEFDAFLKQLCAEVQSRLTEIRHRGKSITLKLMVRSNDAPVETAKFMGHGVCDNLTKTTTLSEFTNDAALIERTVFAIKNGLEVDPKELRGVGIQIGKLDNGEAAEKAPANRLKDMFEVAAQRNVKKSMPVDSEVFEPKCKLRSKRADSLSEIVSNKVAKRGIKRGIATRRGVGRGSTRQASVNDLLAKQCASDSNPDSQIDLAVLAELPDDIRDEALRDFRHNQKQTKKDGLIKIHSDNTCGLDQDFLAALPDDIRAEVIRDQKLQNMRDLRCTKESVKETKIEQVEVEITGSMVDEEETVSDKNIFMQNEWRSLLQEWINSVNDEESGPFECDIQVMGEHATEMVRFRRINELYLCFRYFFRIVEEKQLCVWHRAYNQMVDAMQIEMKRTYGSRLQVKSAFQCPTCASKQSISSPKNHLLNLD